MNAEGGAMENAAPANLEGANWPELQLKNKKIEKKRSERAANDILFQASVQNYYLSCSADSS